MKYEIKKIGRTVDLDDELVEFYEQVGEIRDTIFTIYIKSKYGPNPTEDVISTDELSKVCNELLVDELEVIALLPKAIEIITANKAQIEDAAKNGQLLEFEIK